MSSTTSFTSTLNKADQNMSSSILKEIHQGNSDSIFNEIDLGTSDSNFNEVELGTPDSIPSEINPGTSDSAFNEGNQETCNSILNENGPENPDPVVNKDNREDPDSIMKEVSQEKSEQEISEQEKSDHVESTKIPFPNSLKVHTQCPLPPRPTYSQSMDSFLVVKPLSPQAREQISQELDNLDTGLPELDFKSLEEKLSTAAKEHEESERRKLGDEVRRRLALQYDQFSSGPSPGVNTRPNRSNLGQRLNATKALQVCYMNELIEDDEDSDDDFCFGPSGSLVPKSRSTPNLGRRGLNASELARRKKPDAVGFHDRLTILREETQMMLQQAKKAAKLQMEVEKQKEELEKKILIKRFSRLQLSKMEMPELRNVLEEIKTKIDRANVELVNLLMEKDSLYMEQDSMLVDIEDTVQHTIDTETIDLPPFLYIFDTEANDPSTSKNYSKKSPKASSIPSKNPSKPPESPSKNPVTSFGTGIFSSTRWKIFKQ
ncbi:hypothetical protein FO519_005500 [Halicephalobus sp. NKZ332]|nr:hypothetical protein FO519_005500 [Halicephalobus sp. NKZ332]